MSISKLFQRFVQKYLPLSLGLLIGVAAFSTFPADWLNLSPTYEGVVYSIILGLVSSTTDSCKLNPYFVSGIIDGEGCFFIEIRKNNMYKTGFGVQCGFHITLHKKDQALLEIIQLFFGGAGKITKQREDSLQYRVFSINDLAVIINHLDRYPLITQKRADYELFKQALYLVSRKEHLTPEGLQKLVGIRASINLGLSASLKAAFPNVTPVERLEVKDQKIQDPNWLAGFVSGDGCFLIRIRIYEGITKTGFTPKLEFKVTQHLREEQLMRSLEQFLNCGRYYTRSNQDAGDFIVSKFSDITDKIIPFFKKYPIVGIKANDFDDFCKAAQIMQAKGHLTPEDLEEIRLIKSGMNRGRNT